MISRASVSQQVSKPGRKVGGPKKKRTTSPKSPRGSKGHIRTSLSAGPRQKAARRP